jgi:hypothetical protein
MEQEVSLSMFTRARKGSIHIPLPALELVIGAGLIAVVLRYLYEAYALPAPYNPIDIGAGGFPKLIALATLVALLIMVFLGGYHLLKGGRYFGIIAARRPFFVIAGTLLLIGQAALFEQLGVFTCVGFSAVGIMLAAGEGRIAHLIGVPVALVTFIYVVFAFALNVQLP